MFTIASTKKNSCSLFFCYYIGFKNFIKSLQNSLSHNLIVCVPGVTRPSVCPAVCHDTSYTAACLKHTLN